MYQLSSHFAKGTILRANILNAGLCEASMSKPAHALSYSLPLVHSYVTASLYVNMSSLVH